MIAYCYYNDYTLYNVTIIDFTIEIIIAGHTLMMTCRVLYTRQFIIRIILLSDLAKLFSVFARNSVNGFYHV